MPTASQARGATKRAERWLAENHEAIESSNAFVEKQGQGLVADATNGCGTIKRGSRG